MRYIFIFCLLFCIACRQSTYQESTAQGEPWRPQIHFSPRAHWMNDPNGMVFLKGTWHLFFQYYPDSTVWGPMHWGHATSKDLVHWSEQPIALYPDSLGYIFSGSVVVDSADFSGFAKDSEIPLVAIFTQHDPKGEKQDRIDFQNQSIAYSLDGGMHWTKYAHNPVLKNPGIRDFRDPKVHWNSLAKKWIMTLAVKDHVSFYSSPNLKDWNKESDFGLGVGSHGGVWECPDLFPMQLNGKTIWVLLVSMNPGGPQGGSATQYFTGDFDGHTFHSTQTQPKWIDYGSDDYAGVTWSNTGDRRIFLGWMSNWQYAQQVPTKNWRSAMTLPRELSLVDINDDHYLRSMPVAELTKLRKDSTIMNADSLPLTGPVELLLEGNSLENFSVSFSNKLGEKLVVGYDKTANRYFIDRIYSGKVDFERGFASKMYAPRLLKSGPAHIRIFIDKASIELFGDNGLTTMTAIFFPTEDYQTIGVEKKLSCVMHVWALDSTPR